MAKYTLKEDRFLLKNKDLIPAKRMSKMLGRSESSARQRMKLIGAIPLPESVERFRKESQLKPGNVPPNKGKKWSDFMSKAGQRSSRRSTFKKGNQPHNTKWDGAISIRRDKTGWEYMYIRVALSKWDLLHRYIWERGNGKIPPRMIICFKDRNPGNCNIDNLEMISQAENMRRNTYHRYPKEIANLIQLRGALNRQINKHIKNLKK